MHRDLERAVRAAERFVAQPGAETTIHLTVGGGRDACTFRLQSFAVLTATLDARPGGDLGALLVCQVDGPKWLFCGDASRLERLAQAVEVFKASDLEVAPRRAV